MRRNLFVDIIKRKIIVEVLGLRNTLVLYHFFFYFVENKKNSRVGELGTGTPREIGLWDMGDWLEYGWKPLQTRLFTSSELLVIRK